MFQPQIKVIGCTISDGGLMNKWQFEDDLVKQVFLAGAKAGIKDKKLLFYAAKYVNPALVCQ